MFFMQSFIVLFCGFNYYINIIKHHLVVRYIVFRLSFCNDFIDSIYFFKNYLIIFLHLEYLC